MPFCHLVQIHFYARVAIQEVHSLMKEHRCVAMGVNGYDSLMQCLSMAELSCSLHQPLEYRQSFLAQPFRVPLHSQYTLLFCALHRLYGTIRCCGNGAEQCASIVHHLMMERVYGKFLACVYII